LPDQACHLLPLSASRAPCGPIWELDGGRRKTLRGFQAILRKFRICVSGITWRSEPERWRADRHPRDGHQRWRAAAPARLDFDPRELMVGRAADAGDVLGEAAALAEANLAHAGHLAGGVEAEHVAGGDTNTGVGREVRDPVLDSDLGAA